MSAADRPVQEIVEELKVARAARLSRLQGGGSVSTTLGENKYDLCSMTELAKIIEGLESEIRYAEGDGGFSLVVLGDC